MIIEAVSADRADGTEARDLAEIAAVVLVTTERWLAEGLLGPETALALTQNVLPLTDGTDTVSSLQQRSHARVVAALLLLLDDEDAGALATGLVETLADRGPRE